VTNRPELNRSAISHLLANEDLDDPEIRQLVAIASHAPSDFVRQQAIDCLVQLLLQRRVRPFEVNTHRPIDQANLIRLGQRPSGDLSGVAEGDLTKHLLAVGQSGAGKTTLFYTLCSQLEVPFWSFDLKQDYRHLMPVCDDLIVLPWSELQFNPLVPPPDVSPRRWAQVFSEIFGHATALLSGSKNHLLKTIIELYRVYGLFDECSPPYPSLHELEDVLAAQNINYVRKTANYRDTILNRLEAMNLGAGTVFDCSQGNSLDELLERNVVFEFDGLGRDTQNFLMEILLAAVYEYRLVQGHRSDGLNHVFVLDEGKQVFSVYKERQNEAGIPAIDELTAKLREFGEGLIVGDQEASKLTDSIMANTYTKLLLATGDRKQFDAMVDSMHLSDRQQSMAQDLAVGEAILQTGNDDPVRISLDEYDLDKEISDGELRAKQGAEWASLTATPRERPPAFLDALGVTDEAEGTDTEVIDDPSDDVALSETADRLLEDIIDYPFVSMTERYTLFPNEFQGNKVKTELVDAGLVVERYLKTQAGTKTLLELTEQGRRYTETNLERDPSHDGRGGIIHRYWQHQLKGAFEAAGWATELEMFDADVYVNTGQFELVVEIAMENTQREVDHIEQHLDTGFDVIWIVCRDQDVQAGLRRRLEAAGYDTDDLVFYLVQDVAEQIDGLTER